MESANCTVILDVGHGNCGIVRSNGHTAIIDAGRRNLLLQHITSEDIKVVDLVILSHSDLDHIEGLITLLSSSTVSVKRVVLNSDAQKESDLWRDLIYELDALRRDSDLSFEVGLSSGDAPFQIGEVAIQVLAPSPALAARGAGSTTQSGKRISSNSVSAVLRVCHDGIPRVLFAGDLDSVGLDDIERCEQSLEAPVLVFPHHGGSAGNIAQGQFTQSLITRVSPQLVVFSIARSVRPNNPQPIIVNTLRQVAPGARIQCTQLSTRCAASLTEAPTTHLHRTYASGRRNGCCCAGSILVAHDRFETIPSFEAHSAFVQLAAPTALCREAN